MDYISLAIAVFGSVFGAGWFWRWFTIRNENKKLSTDIDAQQAAIENQRAQTDAFIRAEMQKMFDVYKENAEQNEARLTRRVTLLEGKIAKQEADREADGLRISELESKEKTLNFTITEQGALIMELREKINKQDDRIRTLENENGRLKAENERLKGGGGRRV